MIIFKNYTKHNIKIIQNLTNIIKSQLKKIYLKVILNLVLKKILIQCFFQIIIVIIIKQIRLLNLLHHQTKKKKLFLKKCKKMLKRISKKIWI